MPRHAKPRQTLAEWLGFTEPPMTFTPIPDLSSQSIIPAANVPAPDRPPRGPSGVSRPTDARLRLVDWQTGEPVAGRPEWADVAESHVVERLQRLADRTQSAGPEGVFVWDEFTDAMRAGRTSTQWEAFQAGIRAAAKWSARS